MGIAEEGRWIIIAEGGRLMRIAICEDSKEDTLHLRTALERYLKSNNIDAEIDCFESGEAFLAVFQPQIYQIIFMDIFMKADELTGMETAEQVHDGDEEAAIIFTTTSKDYSIAGYQVAVYYILKPIKDVDLEKAMKKCRKQLDRFAKTIDITVNRLPVAVRLRDIYYIEAQQGTCVFVTAGGVMVARMVFDNLETTLGGIPFLRCHRSYIVNLTHVDDLLDRDFILKNSHRVPISKGALPDVRKTFQQFIRDELRGEMD